VGTFVGEWLIVGEWVVGEVEGEMDGGEVLSVELSAAGEREIVPALEGALEGALEIEGAGVVVFPGSVSLPIRRILSFRIFTFLLSADSTTINKMSKNTVGDWREFMLERTLVMYC